MSMTGRRHGSLYRLDQDGRCLSGALPGLTISNGLGWSPDGTRFYHVDTATGRVDLFDFDMASGTIDHLRVFVAVLHQWGHPDGLVVDADGFVWLALWAGGALHRYAPDGRLDRTVALPLSRTRLGALFGGPDASDLLTSPVRGSS